MTDGDGGAHRVKGPGASCSVRGSSSPPPRSICIILLLSQEVALKARARKALGLDSRETAGNRSTCCRIVDVLKPFLIN